MTVAPLAGIIPPEVPVYRGTTGIPSPQALTAAPGKRDGSEFFGSLESLRGVAALCVVIYHANWINSMTKLQFFQNAALMVDFFFVLSGFVMCHSFGGRLSRPRDVARFMWLRLGRLYPLHITFLLVFLGFEVAKFVAQINYGIVADKPAFTVNGLHAFLTNLLLIQALDASAPLTYNYPSWSISTEFYTYLVFAVLRLISGSRVRFVLTASVLVAGSAAVLLVGGRNSLAEAGNGWNLFRCCGGFFLGVLTYYAYAWTSARSIGAQVRTVLELWSAPIVLALTVTFLCINLAYAWSFLLPLLGAALIFTTVTFQNRFMGRILCTRPLLWLGRISYSTYMVHASIVWIITQILTIVFKIPRTPEGDHSIVATSSLAGAFTLALYLIAVLAISSCTYRWIEDPCRMWAKQISSRWFFQRPAGIL